MCLSKTKAKKEEEYLEEATARARADAILKDRLANEERIRQEILQIQQETKQQESQGIITV